MKLQQNELHELIKALSELPVSRLEVENDGLRIVIEKTCNNTYSIHSNESITTLQEPNIPGKEAQKGIAVSAPIHGTFYSCPAPGEPAFVKAGDRVAAGQTLCILEAMKMMNEIKAPENGIIVSVDVENEETVEKGQALIRYMPER